MKISLTYLKNHLVCLGAAVFLLVSASAAKAQILLTVDITHPDAVVFSATGVAPSQSASIDDGIGVELLSFFQNIQGTLGFLDFSTPVPSTLAAANESTGPFLTQWTNDDVTSGSVPDLALFNEDPSTDATLTFSTDSAAFSGSVTLDLSAYTSLLPSVGTTGTIITGYSKSAQTPIGEYQVVTAPEPSTWLLVLGGVTAIAFMRLKSRAQRAARPARI